MSKKLIDGVNDVLSKALVLKSTNRLTSLTNSGKQGFIDNAIASWNEAVDEIYSKSKVLRPDQGSEDTITLVTGVREYELPCDLIQIRWPLQDETNGRFIHDYKGGYEELRHLLVQPDNYTGQPTMGAISPVDSSLYIDMIPTSTENGAIYTYFYWKDTGMTRATDVFPFSDVVYRALVPVVAELWRWNAGQSRDESLIKKNYGRAVRALKKEPVEEVWIKRRGSTIQTSPLGHDPYRA